MKKFFILLAVFALLSVPAFAAQEVIDFSATIDASTSSTVVTVPWISGAIKEGFVDCPTLDSGDTGAVALKVIPFGGTYSAAKAIVPNGWSDTSIGATADGAVVKMSTSTLSVYGCGALYFTITTSTNQEAARAFKVRLIREY